MHWSFRQTGLQISFKFLKTVIFNFILVLDPKQSGGSFRNGISMQKCQFLAHYYYKNVSSGGVNIGESYFDVKTKKFRVQQYSLTSELS
jgi:hypothetical protein